ncbi:MAG: DUF1343 domain-containing protein, partial [Bacteroidia bacterium]|nr:DUF1343 domain-containing protein [Bacteroidia bacterium]
MTTGEFAQMINGEGWLKGKKCSLTVVKMLNYTHNTEYILPVKPSPNLQSQQSLYLYPSLGLFEGTPVSIGHGTSAPYESFGWPELKWGNLNFKPVSIKGVVEKPKFKNLECTGFILTNHKMTKWGQNRIELNWLVFSYNESKEKPRFFNDFFDKLAGTDILRKQIIAGLTPDQIRESWVPGLEKFKLMRSKYLLY